MMRGAIFVNGRRVTRPTAGSRWCPTVCLVDGRSDFPVGLAPDLTRPGSSPRKRPTARARRPGPDGWDARLPADPGVRTGCAPVWLGRVARRGVPTRNRGHRERRADWRRRCQYSPAARTTTTLARTNHGQPSRNNPAAPMTAAINTPAMTTRRIVVFSTDSPSTRGASLCCGSATSGAVG